MIIRVVLLSILFFSFLFSNVRVLSKNSFLENEQFSFQIEVTGKNIVFPKIDKIKDYIVTQSGSSSQISIINGIRKEKIIKNYSFYAKDSFTLPSFKVLIDNKEYFTKEKIIKKTNVQKTSSNNYNLDISINKKDLLVGEQAILKIVFKYKENLDILDLSLSPISLDGFWYKQVGKTKQTRKSGFIYQELKFLLFPQKTGKLKISPIKIDMALLDKNRSYSFFQTPAKKVSIYSNSLTVVSKKTPNNQYLVGQFNISSSIDKKEIKVGESVSFKVKIEGIGNVDDIKDINLNIPNVTVYENEAKKNFNFFNNLYGGTYEKTFSIVSDKNFIIPEIKISYFNKKENKVFSKSTKEIPIKVISIKRSLKNIKKTQLVKNEESVLNQSSETKSIKTSNLEKFSFFILGVFFTSLFFIIFNFYKKRKKEKNDNDLPLVKKIKKTKDCNELLKVLIPFVNKSLELDDIIFSLEKGNVDFNKSKKSVLQTIKKEKIEEN